ncbi:hypothetical protein [Termitidicoccus mucosus]|uniref:hypothetical protein n=1 Tax=Termitidicoccus mucosus TaxID=1184151 RepID=UPI0011AB6001
MSASNSQNPESLTMNTVQARPTRDIEYFKTLLRRNPELPRPRALEGLSFADQVWERKSANRCYDAARIELGLKTPAQIQEECSAFRFPKNFRPRVVSYHL